MADVLSVLRQFNVNQKAYETVGDLVIFGDQAWQKDCKTNFRIYGATREALNNEYYTLESIVFLLQNVHLPHALYVRQAASSNVAAVRRPDRKDMLAYLKGETTNSSSIDRGAPLAVPVPRPERRDPPQKRPADEESSESQRKKVRLHEELAQRDKERLAAKLDATKESSVIPNQINQIGASSLSQAMSLEKIAALKAKRLAKKRSNIKSVDDEVHERPSDAPSFAVADADATNEILNRERLWKTRTTILQSNAKQFASNILGILQSIKAREEGTDKKTGSGGPSAPSAQATMAKPSQVVPYNRYGQEKHKTREETEGFKIDVAKTFHGMSLKSVTEGASGRGPQPAPPTKPARPVTQAPAHSTTSASPRPPSGSKKVSKTPIIVIPAAKTSLIQMLNVKDILQDLKFFTAEEKTKAGVKRDNEVLLQRQKKEGGTVPYRIVDNTSRLQPQDWDRVVAVFVQGPAWQFKTWPWGGNPTDIFSRVKAFHLQWANLPTDSNVKSWDVTVFKLDHVKRHMDRAVLQGFWEILDKYMAKNKPQLRF